MTDLPSSAHILAQAAAAPAAEAPNQLFQLLPLVLFGAAFYFLLIRPQQKKAKEVEQKQSKLKIGDRVCTSAGVLGKVVSIEDDSVTLQVSEGVRIPFRRSHITEFSLPE